jgi:uncharacterized protein YecE (DUF72 family)
MQPGQVLVGTSGWHYKPWQGVFYPDDVPTSDWLEYYARQFNSVELNNAFYRLPTKKTLRKWREKVPHEFIFTVKASRYITHMKKLKDPGENVSLLLDRVAVLGENLGPLLFQLPPHWRVDTERLKQFLAGLSTDFRYAFEFRDHSWLTEGTCELLCRHNVAFCIYDLDGFLAPTKITADFIYIRLHGPRAPYRGHYTKQALSKWAERITKWSEDGRAVYCYFDNDEAGYAVQNAKELTRMLS